MTTPGTTTNPVVTSMTPSAQGPLGKLNTDSTYGLTILKYPMEIGQNSNGVSVYSVPSFITFNIYVPSSSPYAKNVSPSVTQTQYAAANNADSINAPATLGAPGSTSPAIIAGAAALTGFASGAQNGGGVAGGLVSGVGQGGLAYVSAAAINNYAQTNITLRPQLFRIGTSIQLYMPDTVMSSMNQDYRAVSATEAQGNLGWAALVGPSIAAAISKAFKNTSFQGGGLSADIMGAINYGKGIFRQLGASIHGNPALNQLSGELAESTGLVGPGFTDLALRSAGVAVNPQVELIFNGTANRTFTFEFHFTPRSPQESQTILQIIQTFKQFSSPGLMSGQLGRYFIVPAQFDITFNFNNTTNQFVNKISTCVLTGIDVNYVGQGQWATFSDGSPVDINVQLRFTETQIIYDQLVAQGY